ncbi:MAG: ATP-binding protein, partial [Endomicrobia bacterium]|nr:ATP-binding protein [Endomicrobiia bacterium]
TEAQHLNKVVDDILTVGQKVHLIPFPVDVNKFIYEVMQTIELMNINKEGIEFTLELDENLPTGFFDRDRIKQVMINIIQNAVYFLKSSIKKEIRIKTYLDSEYIVIAISDTGCGIPSDIKDKIFEPFFTTKPNGTGLGLTICRNIVSAHNGVITVESETGKGTTFFIKLPLQKF